MKALFYKFLFSVLLLSFPASQLLAQVPTTSTEGDEVWYYINCSPRNPDIPNAQWLTGAPDQGQILVSEFTQSDAQRWKVVTQGDGFALINKEFGTYMNTDQTWNEDVPSSYLYGAAALPDTPIKFVITNVTFTGKPGVNIINESAVVSADNVVDVETLVFQFYSAGSSVFMPISYGSNAINEHSAVFFMQDKDFLLAAIDKVETVIANSAEGYNPGQFSSENLEGLQQILEESKFVYDDPSTTGSQYLEEANLLLEVFEEFKKGVILPQISTGVETWYYIQGTRPANSYLTGGAAGAGTQIKSLPVIPDDTQLWKLVNNGPEGFSLKNKASGEYLQAGEGFGTGTNLSTQSEMPSQALRFITSTETSNNSFRFWIENIEGEEPAYRLHAGGAGNNFGLMNWTGNANDNSTWLFLGENEVFRAEFKHKLLEVKSLYDLSVQGDQFGQFSSESRAALYDVLAVEQAKDISEMSQEELVAASALLDNAIESFECNRDLSTLSSIIEHKWFRLVNNADADQGNKAMSSNGREVDMNFTFEMIDEASDAQLFRFDLNADKSAVVSIINKANQMFVGANGMILAENPEIDFGINALDAISFEIRPAGSAPLHAQANGSQIVNWESGAGSASAWRFVYVSSQEITDLVTPFQKALANAYTLFEAAAQLQGNKIGQYTEASVTAFSSVITQQEVKDPETMTKEELIAAIEALNAGPDLLSVNSDIKTLVTSDPATSWKWFRLINNQTSGYAAGMAMSSNGRLEEEPFTYEEKDAYSDAQLFRFELNAAETHVASIYNKASELYVDANGKLAAVSTEGNEFEIVQLAEGRSFWIHPTLEALVEESDPEEFLRLAPLHAASAGEHIVNWESGVGSASAWVFEYVETEYLSGLSSLDESKYRVSVNQGVVTVDGVENFEVYSTTGQRQNHKSALNAGVYILKVNNTTKKLIIK